MKHVSSLQTSRLGLVKLVLLFASRFTYKHYNEGKIKVLLSETMNSKIDYLNMTFGFTFPCFRDLMLFSCSALIILPHPQFAFCAHLTPWTSHRGPRYLCALSAICI